MRSSFLAAAAIGCLLSTPLAAQSAHVAKAMTFPGDGQGSIPPQTTFATDTPQITLGLQLKDFKAGDTVKGAWIAEKTSVAPPNYEIDSSTLTLASSPTVAFRLSKPNSGWPTGQYRVDVSYNGGPVEYSQRFEVK